MPGWKVWTVGDDIAWMHLGADGRLCAINPEAGYFGVVPGTNPKTNRNAYEMIQPRHDLHERRRSPRTTSRGGKAARSGTPVIDWQGRPYDTANGPAAHPNSRFTVSAKQNPSYSHARRSTRRACRSRRSCSAAGAAKLAPLVYEARDWAHGVLVGAGMASETTAAADRRGRRRAPRPDGDEAVLRLQLRRLLGALAVVRRAASSKLPKIFHVNWFRQDENGKFLWPGFGDNLRVLRWIIERCEGRVGAAETPIGYPAAARATSTCQGLDARATATLRAAARRRPGRVAHGDRRHRRVPGRVRRARCRDKLREQSSRSKRALG